MKLGNSPILFAIIILPFIFILDMKVNYIAHLSKEKNEYDKKFQIALDDGISNLVELDKNGHVKLHKENAINEFYKSLYSNFAITNNKLKQEKLKSYIPIILITDIDGFYILHYESKDKDGEKVLRQRFSEKKNFYYSDLNYNYIFTLKDYIYVYNKNQFKIAEGPYLEVLDRLNKSSLDVDNYTIIKQNCIINHIEEEMNYYINTYNDLANNFGLEYEFWLPEIDTSTWVRTISDISLLVIMQGYPYEGIGDLYNQVGVTGSRIKKQRMYIKSSVEDISYYHRESCSYINIIDGSYSSKEEAALSCSYPCIYCNP